MQQSGLPSIRVLAKFSAPLASTFFAMMANGFFLTFQSLFMNEFGYSKLSIGLVQACYFFGLLVGAWKIPRLIQRVGHIQTLASLSCIGTISVLVQSLDYSLYTWCFARFCSGIALATLYVVIESWMLEHSEDHQRGGALAAYMIVLGTGYALSQQLLPYVQASAYSPFIVSALFWCASILPISLTTRKSTLAGEPVPYGFRKLIALSPVGSFGCLVVGILIGSVYSFMPIYATGLNLRPEHLLTAFVLGGPIMQWPVGLLSDKMDRRWICLVLTCTTIVPIGLLLGAGNLKPSYAYLVVFMLGSSIYALYPVCIAQVADRFTGNHLVEAIASLVLLYGLGSTLGPLISSAAVQQFGSSGLVVTLGGTLGVYLVAVILSLQIRRPTKGQERVDFVAVPRTSLLVAELDPRTEQTKK